MSNHRYLMIALLALAAACDGASSPQGPEDEPAATPAIEAAVTPGTFPGKIVFSSFDGTQQDLYVMNADGSSVTRLTSFAGNEQSPAWSWDNSKIAFLRGRADGSNTVHNDIFIVDANGANGHWASPTPSTMNLRDPAWAPDGSRLLVGSPVGIMSLDLATGALTHFKNGQEDVIGFDPSFDATGQKVVVGGSGVSVYKADGTGRIGADMVPPHGGTVESPCFSPDGSKILFTEATVDRGRTLYLLTGTTLAVLANHGVGVGASWAPDSKAIVYAGTRGDLYRINPDGSHRVRLGGSAGGDIAPDYTH